jgi:hypothetical protein
MSSLSLPWPIKGGLDTPFHHTPTLKQSSSHSHPQQSKGAPSPLPANFVQPHSPSSQPHSWWSSHWNAPNFLQYVLPYVSHNISKNRCKRNRDATRITPFMAAAPCLHAFCAHDWDSNFISSLFWYLLDASTTPQCVPWCPHYISRSVHRAWSQRH